jgi:hypothetical protein
MGVSRGVCFVKFLRKDSVRQLEQEIPSLGGREETQEQRQGRKANATAKAKTEADFSTARLTMKL